MRTQLTWRLKGSPSALVNLFRVFAAFAKRRSHAPLIAESILTGISLDPERVAAFLSICYRPPYANANGLCCDSFVCKQVQALTRSLEQ